MAFPVKKKRKISQAPPADLLADLPAPLRVLLARTAGIAQAQGAAVWLVGGVVRDLLLGVPLGRDLDLAIEGDVLALTDALAAQGGQVTARHEPFGTATVEVALSSLQAAGTLPAERATLTLDLARTRTEHYPQPAALPIVQPASITDDLGRRDFSINAMALQVQEAGGEPAAGHFLDPFAGRRDLAAGVLRVLHERSFTDDPTRILRGLRLAARLDLHFEPQTWAWLAEALAGSMLEATTPDRVRAELCLALEEPHPGAVLQRACDLHITPHIFAPLQRCAARSAYLQVAPQHSTLVRTGLLTYDLAPPEREALIARYRLPNDAAKLLCEVGQLRALLSVLRPDQPNSEIDRLLRPFGIPALHVVRYVESGLVGEMLTHYVEHLRSVKPLLDGHALQQLGIAPGPQLGALLAGLRAARLDGQVVTRADEEAWVRRQCDPEH